MDAPKIADVAFAWPVDIVEKQPVHIEYSTLKVFMS
jgi:hypothetical protein